MDNTYNDKWKMVNENNLENDKETKTPRHTCILCSERYTSQPVLASIFK